jgi:hypothetical protein
MIRMSWSGAAEPKAEVKYATLAAQGKQGMKQEIIMSKRALEFVEEWVSEKIEGMEELPAEGDEAAVKELAAECLAAARQEGIPDTEVNEAFDDLAAFINGQIEEAVDRGEDSEDEDDEEYEDEDEEEDDDDDDDDDDADKEK